MGILMKILLEPSQQLVLEVEESRFIQKNKMSFIHYRYFIVKLLQRNKKIFEMEFKMN